MPAFESWEDMIKFQERYIDDPVDLLAAATKKGLSLEDIQKQTKLDHLPDRARAKVLELLVENQTKSNPNHIDVGLIPGVECTIDTPPDARPVYCKPIVLSEDMSKEMRRQLDQLLAADLVEPSTSPWAARSYFNRKPNGSFCMILDFRPINAVTKKNRWPIPRMDQMLKSLAGNKIFSALDMRSGYNHIALREEDREKTAFVTEYGLFQWKRMPWGICNAPAIFQAAMQHLLRGIEYVMVYIDDILIATPDLKTHMDTLAKVFERLKRYKCALESQQERLANE
jgi:hypothetical protein